PAGSVAVTEGFCAIYPSETPGGWNIIGRTSKVVCDVTRRDFLFAVGDRVVFREERS
ncbi:carboxyltransferase domain-containing protein, partial [Escherichia coli]|uniref:carboxyltransferase domain-containing protein n=1 Tax=Escherichia coli TaxID=562 RepID=UPI003CE524C0